MLGVFGVFGVCVGSWLILASSGYFFFLLVCAVTCDTDGKDYGKGDKQRTYLPGPLYLYRRDTKFVGSYLDHAKKYGHKDGVSLRKAAYREDIKWLQKYQPQNKQLISEIEFCIEELDHHREHELKQKLNQKKRNQRNKNKDKNKDKHGTSSSNNSHGSTHNRDKARNKNKSKSGSDVENSGNIDNKQDGSTEILSPSSTSSNLGLCLYFCILLHLFCACFALVLGCLGCLSCF